MHTFYMNRKLRSVLTNRIIKFLSNVSKKQPEEYNEFYKDYHVYLKAGVIYTDSHEEKVQYQFYMIMNVLRSIITSR